MGAAIGRRRKLFACEVVKNASAGVVLENVRTPRSARSSPDRYANRVLPRADGTLCRLRLIKKRQRGNRWTTARTRRDHDGFVLPVSDIPVLHTETRMKFTFARTGSSKRSEVHNRRRERGDENYYVRVHKNSGLCRARFDLPRNAEALGRKLNSWHPRNFYGRIKNTSSVVLSSETR